MLKYIFSLVFCGVLFNSSAQKFNIDPGHTAITSKVERFGMVYILGRFSEIEGEINFDPENLNNLSAEVVIKTASYSSNNVAGEQAVKSPAFLDVTKFPDMIFVSDRVENRKGELTMFGKLTLHGITKDIQFPFTLINPSKDPTGENTLAVHAILSLNRLDYGITFSRKLPNGKEFIGTKVQIELNVLAVHN